MPSFRRSWLRRVWRRRQWSDVGGIVFTTLLLVFALFVVGHG